MPNSDLEILLGLMPGDFTLSNAKQFNSSKGDPLGTKGLRNLNARLPGLRDWQKLSLLGIRAFFCCYLFKCTLKDTVS